MRNFSNQYTSVQEALTTAQTVLIALSQKPTLDQIASGLALFLSLEKLGKKVKVVSAEEMKVAFSSLVGVDKIKTGLGGNNLTVSFDYVEEAVEKVSYNIDKGKFNLVIQPREGGPPLSAEKVEYRYSGSQADLIFIVGSSSLNDLGELYQENKSFFDEGKVINLDCRVGNTQFGVINLVDDRASSCAEIVIDLLAKSRWPVDADIAGNLFFGLKKATKGFSSPKTTPAAFEGAAFCLRAGAGVKRIGFQGPNFEKGSRGISELKPMPTEVSAEKVPSEKPSPDWFEPKIFKGQTRI